MNIVKHCKVSNLTEDESYYVACEGDCRDQTDFSAYRICVETGEVITMGEIVVEPSPEYEKSEAQWDVFWGCDPLMEDGIAPFDCDPRAIDSPYRLEELNVLNSQRRVWTATDHGVGYSSIMPGLHSVNAYAYYVTEKPVPNDFPV